MDAPILLVSKPGHVRDGMESLLKAGPGLCEVITADSGLLALKMLRELSGLAVPGDVLRTRTAGPRPVVVLIEGSLPEAEVPELVRQIKEGWPEVGCLVLAERTNWRERALVAGADRVLGVGVPAGRVYPVLQEMLSAQSSDQGKEGADKVT